MNDFGIELDEAGCRKIVRTTDGDLVVGVGDAGNQSVRPINNRTWDAGGRRLAIEPLYPYLDRASLLQLVRQRGVRRNTDAGDGQVSLGCRHVGTGADDMLKQVNSVVGQRVRILAGYQINDSLLDRPHVDATIRPVGEHDVQTATRRAQVVTRAEFRTRTLERFLDQLCQVKIECCGSRSLGHYRCLAVFCAIFLGCATNCLPAFFPARLARVVAAYSAGVKDLIADSGRYRSPVSEERLPLFVLHF